MKITISIIYLILLFMGYIIIQPLTKFNPQFTSEISTIFGAIIGATGSIIGGIIGGVITGKVAFKVARYQLTQDDALKTKERTKRLDKYKAFILDEIATNNALLKTLDEASSTEEIVSILRFSLSNEIYLSVKTELEVDTFFQYSAKYYRILNRLMLDTSIHNENSFETVDDEIQYLFKKENELKSLPTTTK